MPSQRKQKVKKRLKKELLSVRKYKTTYKDIKKFFRLINENVFNGKLSPFNDVNIMDMNRKRCIGQVLILEWERKGTKAFNLEMNKTYRNKKEFVDTLGHEMIHLFQMANLGDTGNHNDIFYSFRPKLNAIGLDI